MRALALSLIILFGQLADANPCPGLVAGASREMTALIEEKKMVAQTLEEGRTCSLIAALNAIQVLLKRETQELKDPEKVKEALLTFARKRLPGFQDQGLAPGSMRDLINRFFAKNFVLDIKIDSWPDELTDMTMLTSQNEIALLSAGPLGESSHVILLDHFDPVAKRLFFYDAVVGRGLKPAVYAPDQWERHASLRVSSRGVINRESSWIHAIYKIKLVKILKVP